MPTTKVTGVEGGKVDDAAEQENTLLAPRKTTTKLAKTNRSHHFLQNVAIPNEFQIYTLLNKMAGHQKNLLVVFRWDFQSLLISFLGSRAVGFLGSAKTLLNNQRFLMPFACHPNH